MANYSTAAQKTTACQKLYPQMALNRHISLWGIFAITVTEILTCIHEMQRKKERFDIQQRSHVKHLYLTTLPTLWWCFRPLRFTMYKTFPQLRAATFLAWNNPQYRLWDKKPMTDTQHVCVEDMTGQRTWEMCFWHMIWKQWVPSRKISSPNTAAGTHNKTISTYFYTTV